MLSVCEVAPPTKSLHRNLPSSAQMGQDLRIRPPQLSHEWNPWHVSRKCKKKRSKQGLLLNVHLRKSTFLNYGRLMEEWLVVDDMIAGFIAGNYNMSSSLLQTLKLLKLSEYFFLTMSFWILLKSWWQKKFQLLQRFRIECKFPLVLFDQVQGFAGTF